MCGTIVTVIFARRHSKGAAIVQQPVVALHTTPAAHQFPCASQSGTLATIELSSEAVGTGSSNAVQVQQPEPLVPVPPIVPAAGPNRRDGRTHSLHAEPPAAAPQFVAKHPAPPSGSTISPRTRRFSTTERTCRIRFHKHLSLPFDHLYATVVDWIVMLRSAKARARRTTSSTYPPPGYTPGLDYEAAARVSSRRGRCFRSHRRSTRFRDAEGSSHSIDARVGRS